MSGSVSKTRKRKISDSPTRKKARTEKSGPPVLSTTTTPTMTDTMPAKVDLQDTYEDFLRAIGEVDQPQPPQPLVGTPTMTQAVTTKPTVTGPKPNNPFAGRVKRLRGNFGQGYHDVAHFQPTLNKSYHGVWGAKRSKVQAWVRRALRSIHDDDGFVVDSKPGKNGGYNYLISMDGTTVGYLSGSSISSGEKPPSTHIEVYLDKKGSTVSAFPSSPEIF